MKLIPGQLRSAEGMALDSMALYGVHGAVPRSAIHCAHMALSIMVSNLKYLH